MISTAVWTAPKIKIYWQNGIIINEVLAMAYQVWIRCQRAAVQQVKLILETKGNLSKNVKVKTVIQNGYMLVPTDLWFPDRNEQNDTDIINNLGLDQAGLDVTPELICVLRDPDQKHIKGRSSGVVKGFVLTWLEALPQTLLSEIGATVLNLITNCPRRWSVYQPMILLPAGSFQSQLWAALLNVIDITQQNSLWRGIIQTITSKDGGVELTHLGVNSGIPLNKNTAEDQRENILRSPSGLIMLYGDWGPELNVATRENPTETDFHKAFWVRTKQNGIHQTWAPRYTMFSRGNIKEKARILSFHDKATAKNVARRKASDFLLDVVATDLYAGIGYFAFSYAQIGIGKVLCWEINPWSVEGLRRGIEMNGWSYNVVKGEGLRHPLRHQLDGDAKIVVFEESNDCAVQRIEELRHAENGNLLTNDILHVNCGFLPTSEPSWKAAWKILCKTRDGWLHLHENIGVDDIEQRKRSIEREMCSWTKEDGSLCTVEIDHVELVKTFAPGIWHVVFDIHVAPQQETEVRDSASYT